MKKDVLISICGTQAYENEEPQKMEFVTGGSLFQRNGVYCVSYTESEMTGLEGVVTTFEVHKDKIILQREGALNSQMVFEEGIKNESLYDMGFGALLLGVCAKRVAGNLGSAGGSFDIDYAVEIERSAVGTNSYHVNVKELPN